ncbi:predicted murein hydrolase (TIGR00659 family) [Ureibacillus acetophenoni]|uniref:Predicted murein hydrolase (TIGR00659 family) n=1 Tax=Ureibacillus acetophenoni TaxID=614649 RepID=A0A285TZT7_9BACL|nr:predicted murein hydrolase (TIGR00659 family) [Ureibacillus acetophenoni]
MNVVLSIISTIVIYLLMAKLYQRFNYPFLLPVVTASIIIIVGLLVLHIPYEVYMEGGKWLQHLLGPAIVGLAYPLYNQRHLLVKYKYSIISGLFIAMISGLISVYVLLVLFKVERELILTALPKSLTTPIAMQVSETIGGIAPLTAALVMIAGFAGAIFGPAIYKLAKINSPISRGISMGSASHGVGISKLNEYGEEDLSIGSVSMSLSAVIGAVICPIFAILFL